MLEGSRLRLVSALGAPVIAAAGAMLIVSWAAASGSDSGIVSRLLAPESESWLRVVPGAIVFLLIWALVDLVFKGIAMIQARQSIAAARSLRTCPQAEMRERAAVVGRASWPLLRSLAVRVGEVLDGSDPDRTHAQFRHECEMEAERGAGSYGLVRLFIWAMPILGFIGTVMGIGQAVSEFAGFLSGDIEDVDVVKTQLSSVSTGLSFAFDTTLLGLGASLVSMVAVSLVQRQEESLLADVERGGLALLELKNGWMSQPPEVSAVTGDAENLATTLHGLAQGFREQTQALTEASRRLQDEMAPLRDSIEVHTQRMVEAGGRRPVAAPERRAVRFGGAVAAQGASDAIEEVQDRGGRDPFWRAPWTSAGGGVGARTRGATAGSRDPAGDGDVIEEADADKGVPVDSTSARNRLAIMWGFGLLFLGTGSTVVAGWLLDRALVPPDVALVALIVGAAFWSMSALSAE